MEDFSVEHKERWNWTAMIMQPQWITQDVIEAVTEKVEKKLGRTVRDVRFDHFHEGRAAQIMHLGPYIDEGPTIEALHSFIAEQSLSRQGHHHEIYLTDPRRSKPERMKTIIRQPVR